MNRQGNIDGVLEAWFLDGPNEMPDRVFDAVLDRVERVPQRPLSRLIVRFSDMSGTARLIAAGAAAVLAIGVGFAVLGRNADNGPASSPPPSGVPSASPSAPASFGAIPPELAHVFLGPSRQVTGIAPGDRSVLDLDGGQLIFWSGQQPYLRSDVAMAGDELVLTAQSGLGGCAEGDVGRYAWSMTPGESFLTMDSVADACQARLEALAGTWQRSACRIAEDLCLGALEAETYSSLFVRPDLAPGAAQTADYGAIAYTVPAGWANAGDQADQYTLMRASDYAAGGANIGRNPPDAITVLVNPFAARLHAGCPEEAEPGIGTDRAALTAWILQHPGLEVTQQPDITIDGRPASVFDLEQAEAWTETCPDVQPFVAAPVFYHDYHWALAKNDLMRVVLLDVNPGATTAVTIEVQDPTTYDQLIADAMPIVESLDFK